MDNYLYILAKLGHHFTNIIHIFTCVLFVKTNIYFIYLLYFLHIITFRVTMAVHFFEKNDDGLFELIGFHIFGVGCAPSTLAPDVYVDVYFYKDWILANTVGADIIF